LESPEKIFFVYFRLQGNTETAKPGKADRGLITSRALQNGMEMLDPSRSWRWGRLVAIYNPNLRWSRDAPECPDWASLGLLLSSYDEAFYTAFMIGER